MSPEDLAELKKRLLQQRLDLEAKIQQAKEEGLSSVPTPPPAVEPSPEQDEPQVLEHVETEETMSFSAKTQEAAMELADFTPKRRTSIIELNSSTVPVLPMLGDSSDVPTKEAEGANAAEPESSPGKAEVKPFRMPSATRKADLMGNLVGALCSSLCCGLLDLHQDDRSTLACASGACIDLA